MTLTAARTTALSEALAARIDGEVRLDDPARAAYSTDGSNFCTVPLGVVIDWSAHCHQLGSVDPENRRCTVDPGIVLDALNDQLAEHHVRSFQEWHSLYVHGHRRLL